MTLALYPGSWGGGGGGERAWYTHRLHMRLIKKIEKPHVRGK